MRNKKQGKEFNRENGKSHGVTDELSFAFEKKEKRVVFRSYLSKVSSSN